MNIDLQTRKSIIRNVLLSLFIYLLPILLMFGSFYISGKKPWQKKAQAAVQSNTNINQLNKKP